MNDPGTFLANYFSFLGNMYWICYLLVIADVALFVVNLFLKVKILSVLSTIITVVLVLIIFYGFAGLICAQMGIALPGTNYYIAR